MKRESRNGLRPVTFREYQSDELVKGYFLHIATVGNSEDGIDVWATVEKEDGTVTQVDPYCMKFDDVEGNL